MSGKCGLLNSWSLVCGSLRARLCSTKCFSNYYGCQYYFKHLAASLSYTATRLDRTHPNMNGQVKSMAGAERAQYKVKRDCQLKTGGEATLVLKYRHISAYLYPLNLLPRELQCISQGLHNQVLPSTQHSNHHGWQVNQETERLRRHGKHIFQYYVLHHLKVFRTLSYLSNPELEISNDVETLLGHEIIEEFMRLNSLTQDVEIQSRFLKNEFIEKELFLQKKQKILKATTIGSFYTMVGIVHINHNAGYKEFMDKMMSGSRGFIEILKNQN